MRKIVSLFLLAMAVVAPLGLRAQDECSVTLPWSENFDSYTAVNGTSKPDCWTRLSGFQVNATTVRPNLYSFGGGKVLYFNGQGTGSGVMQIATPYINAALNNMEISFRCSGEGLMLYAAPDTADESTWVLIGTFGSGSMFSWTNVELHTDTISGIPADNGFLVFASAYGTTYGTGRLDDLAVTALTGCDKPASVSAENVGPATATISWDAVDGVPSYLVYYKADGDEDWVEIEEYTTSTALANLQPGTTYTVKVRSWCGVGDTSDVRSTTFTTQQSCYSVLNLVQVGTSVDAASFAWEYSALGYEAAGALAVLHDETDTEAEDVVVEVYGTSHIFTGLDRTHQYTVSLYALCNGDTAEAVSAEVVFVNCGESPLNAGVNDYSANYPLGTSYLTSYTLALYDADILYSMDTLRGIALHRALTGTSASLTRTISIYIGHTTLDSLTSNIGTTGMTQVANGVSYTLAAQEWDTLLFTTPFVYDGHSNVLVALQDNTGSEAQGANWYYHASEGKLFYSNHGSYGDNSAGVYRQPDLRFVGECNNDFSCEPPVLALGEVDSTSAIITWYGTPMSDYVVEYRIGGTLAWTAIDTVNFLGYSFSDLTPDTYYEVRVGIMCDTMVRYSTVLSFSTDCAMMHLPFHFTQAQMCTAADNGFSSCWNFSQYIYRGRMTNSHRGYLRNVDHNQWVMLPAIAEPLSGARLRTWAASSSPAKVKVGIASGTNISNVVWVDTLDIEGGNPDEVTTEYISYLDNYTGTGNRVVVSPIVYNDFQYVFFFDFHVEPIEACRPVTNLQLEAATDSSLTVSWTAVGDATEWMVLVNGTPVDTVSNDPSCTIQNLAPYTKYDVTVRGLCGDEEISDATSAEFRTACSGESCTFTIYAHSADDGWKGASLVVEADGETIGRVKPLGGTEESHTFTVCANMPVSFSWLSGNNDEECSFEIVNANGDTLSWYNQNLTITSGVYYETNNICGAADTGNVDTTTAQYTVTVEYDATRGSVSGAGTYYAGSTVTLTATPNNGYSFTGWSISPISSSLISANPYMLTITSDITVVAHFEAVTPEGIDAVGDASLCLAPNPASSVVSIDGIAAESTVRIVDVNGREAFRREGVTGSVKVDVSSFAKGVYFVCVVTPQSTAMQRLIVK